MKCISQMPVVLIPLHFDRDPVDRKPSAQRSIVLRPFSSSDFMTGTPIIPGSEQLPLPVSYSPCPLPLIQSILPIGHRSNVHWDYQQCAGHFACPLRSHEQAAWHHGMGVRSVVKNFSLSTLFAVKELNNRCIIIKKKLKEKTQKKIIF